MPSKKGSAAKASSKPKDSVPDEGAHIIFGDGPKKGKKAGKAKDNPEPETSGPPKPTAKQIIGGASWTGKLPVNLLSEHTQRQKWNKPEYSMRQIPGRDGHDKLYRSEVTLSRTDPKTRETTTLAPFRTPESLVTASEEPSALEARHFAAAYALFRVNSMKNMSMALPPKYRDLWKDFQSVKKIDEKEGKAWWYDADPFAAQQKTKEIHQAMEKKKADDAKKVEAAAKNPALALQQMPRSREWERAPKIDMGLKIRAEIESLIRIDATWNPYATKISGQERRETLKILSGQGFRPAHIEEALQYCGSQDEVLEWLLIHVPEDDLPSFALPSNYVAGISLASGDVATDAKLKRLAVGGYSRDFVAEGLRLHENDEFRTAFWLQNSLHFSQDGDLNDDIDSSVEWDGEKMTLEAIYGDRYVSTASNECIIDLELPTVSSVRIRFMIPRKGYPFEMPVVLIDSLKLPAYIRLSATKQVLEFAETNFKGVAMVYSVCEWLEANLETIIDNPMSLMELHLTSSENQVELSNTSTADGKSRSRRAKGNRVDQRSSKEIFDAWKTQQSVTQKSGMLTARQRLPAWAKQDQILTAIRNNRVTVVTGETGSGKSTQVVQFVLDQAIQQLKGSDVKIVCTQPRRVAALSLADRVSNERCTELGGDVGYVIRGESKQSSTTKITFMTTGVLLRQIQTSETLVDALSGISHVFVDEVHERSLDTDFLLALLKDALKSNPNLKIVLMSATLDKDLFVDYFGGKNFVAHAHIEGRTFPVNDSYLEDVLQYTGYISSAGADEEQSIGKVIQNLGTGINYDLITDLVSKIDQDLGSQSGAILIFLPGTLEIERCLRAVAVMSHVDAYPLHASLLPAEQKKVFPPAPAGRRKVIAATNVAETSITIEDIVAVIDTGRVKETNYDTTNNIVRLEEVWASQAACKQRRGRAGRVREGQCYKLFTRNTESKMASKPLPEIQRVPLEQLCLSVKATGSDRDVSMFLGSLLTQPSIAAIRNALDLLELIGALEKGQLTALGTYLSAIPADLRCAKLLVYGALFSCLEPCLTIASILTVRDPFVSPRDKREEADAAKRSFSTQHGDLILSLSAYDQYSELCQQLRYRDIQKWCNENFMSHNTLRDITSTRSQFLESIKDAGLVPLKYRLSESASKDHSPQLLRALIAAALQPQIAEIRLPEKKYIQSLTGAKELDPEAKTIKYFIPPLQSDLSTSSSTTPSTSRSAIPTPTPQPDSQWQRVFIHPSSPLFHSTPASFSNASYLSYFNKMATGASSTLFGPKTYVHSLTPLNTYTQLLFGSGGIQIDTKIPGGGLTVSGSHKIRGWARIGVLVSRLRRLLDEELRNAIDLPAERQDFAGSEVVRIVKWLVELNGQDR